MNIVFFSSDNSLASGAFLSMVKLCIHLKNDFGHNPIVILPRKGSGEELLIDNDIAYKYVRSFNWIIGNDEINSISKRISMKLKFFYNAIICHYLAWMLKSLNADLVHINTSWTYIGALAAKEAKIPYIWHIREFLEEDQNVRIYSRLKGYRLIEKAASVIAISNSIFNKYNNILNSDKLVTIFNGIDPAAFVTDSHMIMQSEIIKIAMIGTISESKGQYQLIEAIGRLKGTFNKTFIVNIVGSGSSDYVKKLKDRVKELELDTNISFVGFQKNATKYYRWADIVCVCSKAEAFGRITVEAMMAGALIIGAECGATKELIKHGETGLLYKYGDFEDFSEQIKVAACDVDYSRKIANCGTRYMLNHMTSYNNAKKIDGLYKEVLANLDIN